MELYVKEKLLSMRNKYYIYNSDGEVEYEIESKILSFGAKTTIYDKSHNIVAYIEQEAFHLMPRYNVFIDNEYKYQIKKVFKLFKNDYELSNLFKVDGSTFNLDFAIADDRGNEIAVVNRKLLSVGDKYKIDILDENYLKIILTIIVAITRDIDRSQDEITNSSNKVLKL